MLLTLNKSKEISGHFSCFEGVQKVSSHPTDFQNSLKKDQMLRQFPPLFSTQLVRSTLVAYPSLCSTCVTCGTPCHTIGRYLLSTQPCYQECYGFEGAFFAARHFLPCTRSCFFKASLGPAV